MPASKLPSVFNAKSVAIYGFSIFGTSHTYLLNDQGKVRVAKLFPGDIDNDGQGDLIFSSASFAQDKPQLFMIEHQEEDIVVGKDILELLGSAMYADPMNVYREYIQNAVDAVDEAEAAGERGRQAQHFPQTKPLSPIILRQLVHPAFSQRSHFIDL